jgi:hypothetical protein
MAQQCLLLCCFRWCNRLTMTSSALHLKQHWALIKHDECAWQRL